MLSIQIPSTSANLGVLFDKGAVALDAFRNIISVEKSDEASITIKGEGRNHLPGNKKNLVCKAIDCFYNQTGISKHKLSIAMTNGIPLSRGLGSSAACIAGGIYIANEMEGGILSKKEVIMMAAEMEGHGDNVCAAVTGGFAIFTEDNYREIPAGDNLAFIIYIPPNKLGTKKSRSVLPADYDYRTIKRAESLEQSMMKALYDKDYEKAGALMEKDIIHQPYRKNLIAYWDEVTAVSKEAGVWGTALSGAGPSMISICSKNDMQKIVEKLKKSVDIKYKLNIIGCEMDIDGITVIYKGEK